MRITTGTSIPVRTGSRSSSRNTSPAGDTPERTSRGVITRAACHAELYRDMRAEGVALWRCALVWAAVTIKHPRRP
jgi:hypothetical protein